MGHSSKSGIFQKKNSRMNNYQTIRNSWIMPILSPKMHFEFLNILLYEILFSNVEDIYILKINDPLLPVFPVAHLI